MKNFVVLIILILALFNQYTLAQNKNEMFKLSGLKSDVIRINETFTSSAEIFPFNENEENIFGLAVSANIELQSEESVVRLILIDENLHEYLIYETYALLDSISTISVNELCEETGELTGIKGYSIKIEITDAEVNLKDIITSDQPLVRANNENKWKEKKKEQNEEKIKRINKNLKRKGLHWVAGPTGVAEMSYEERRKLFGQSTFPAGFEFYSGGIISTGGTLKSVSESSMVESWDWRSRHGQNWITPVTNQGGCGSCWAFSATGATEAMVKLFFNRSDLNLNLSEQDVLSCSNSGDCDGGYTSGALNYIKNDGIVDENTFPYSASDQPCENKGNSPSELIKTNGYTSWGSGDYPRTEDGLKKMVIEKGALSIIVSNWSHAIVLVGYQVVKEGDIFYYRDINSAFNSITVEAGDPLIGKTLWILKNSWGTWWGDDGYLYLESDLSNLYSYAIKTPVLSEVTNYNVECADNDGDGYYWWGLGDKPVTCNCPDTPDGNDDDPALGPLDEYGNCIILGTPPVADFEVSKGNVSIGEVVDFIDLSGNGALEWFWDFGDNSTDTVRNPSHFYNEVGTFDVTLISKNLYGSDTILKEDLIVVEPIVGCPQHFHPVWEGTSGVDLMSINIWDIKLDGEELSLGDEIGVFDGDLCVGYARVEHPISYQYLLEVLVSHDDGTGNGFIDGNEIFYKIWDCSESSEYSVWFAGYYDEQLNAVDDQVFESNGNAFVALDVYKNPFHFEKCWSGSANETMHLNIFSAGWGESQVEYGDEIGVFDGEKCVGVGKVTQQLNLENALKIEVSLEDGIRCGYTTGNIPVFKLWDSGTYKELSPLNAYFYINNNGSLNFAEPNPYPFEPRADVYVSLWGTNYVETILRFNEGWNIFSVPLVLDSPDMLSNFQSFVQNNTLVKIQDELGNSLEDWGIQGGWTNTIGEINPAEGYKIKLDAEDSLWFYGQKIEYPFAIPLKQGWNIMSFPSLNKTNAMEVIQDILNNGTLIKVQDEGGNSIEDWGAYGDWQNYIGNFEPGKGYKVKVSDDATLWIYEYYPKSTVIQSQKTATRHFIPAFKGNGTGHMNINLVDLPQNILEEGNEFAVFDGPTCVGAVTLTPDNLIREKISIAASAEDNQGMSGFKMGNPFVLKYWDSNQNSEFVLEPEIISGSSTFKNNGTTFASLEKYVTSGLQRDLKASLAEVKCYPNPFSDQVTIEIILVKNSKVHVELLNHLGQKVKTIMSNQILSKGLNKISWDGKNENGTFSSNGIYFLQICMGDLIIHQKIVLSK